MEMIGLTNTIETFAFPKQETVATDNRVTTSSSPGLTHAGVTAAKDLTALKRPASDLVKSHVGVFSPEKRRRRCGHSPVSDELVSTSCVKSLAVKPENTWVDSGQVTLSTHLVKSECPTVESTDSSKRFPCHDTAHTGTAHTGMAHTGTGHTGTGFTPFEDICLKQLLEVSRQKLFRSLEEVRANDARPDEPRTVRCRSLPSRMTQAKNSVEITGLGGGLRNTSVPTSAHSNLLSSLLGAGKDDQESSDSSRDGDGGAANDSEVYDTSECEDSGTPTSPSGFIDIEADTPPCSPLNLTITGESASQQFHSCDARRQQNASPGTRAPRIPSKSEVADKEKPALCRCGTSCSGGTCKERRTNFSIDAILRPDFGSGNSPNQDARTPHADERDHSDLTQRTHERFSSPHSAFKVVDLRTRSRSESLSSPSSSSTSSRSSPSPPLASPSSLHHRWAREAGGVTKRTTPKGHDRFNFPHSLFPNPSKDLENFIGRHFPFIGPPQGNPLAKFPNVFPDQLSHLHPGIPPECVDPRAFYYAPENFFSKGQQPILSYDMSKIFGRSLNPYMGTPSKPQQQKRPHLAPTPAEGATLKTVSTNHNSKPAPEVKTSVPPPAAEQKRKPRYDPGTRVKQSADQSIHVKENSQRTDPVLKQEKASRKDSPAAASPDNDKTKNPLWPAWVFCTRYSDRPSSGPRSRKPKRSKAQDEKRPRTAFTNDQLQRLKREFDECRYLTETRRKNLADELGLTESQIKIWFQNKRAKIKKSVGVRNPLALQLMEQGLYNHSTIKEMMEEGMYQHTHTLAGDDSS